MIAAFDVHYLQDQIASAAAVLFFDYADAAPASETVCRLPEPAAYVPGALYRRELPCLLALLEQIETPIEEMIVDGYAALDGGRPGLGRHLFEASDGAVAVVGVAKTRFAGAAAVTVFRGQSRRPLYVSAVGKDPDTAAADIRAMHGAHRIPTMLRRADRLARDHGRTGAQEASARE